MCDTHHCQCGQATHPDNLCGHGIASGICCVCEECMAFAREEGIISDTDTEDAEEPYKTCCDCDYEWETEAFWEKGKGRVAFDKENGEVCCSMCEKGVEEYIPSDDEEEEQFCENGDFSCLPLCDIEADEDEIMKCPHCDGYCAKEDTEVFIMGIDDCDDELKKEIQKLYNEYKNKNKI